MDRLVPSHEQHPAAPASFNDLVSELRDFVIVILDVQGHFKTWNPGVESCFGYPPDEFIGRHLEILFPPADRMRGLPRLELDEAIERGRSSDTRWLLKRNGDRVFTDGITLRLLDEEGNLRGFGKVVRDSTPFKNIEDNLVALTRALDQSIVIVRRFNGVIAHWTAGCERFYGWSPAEAIGQCVHSLLQTKFSEPLHQIQRQLLTDGVWKGEVQQIRRDGTALDISAHWVLLQESPDDVVSVIETLTNITERAGFQRELEEAHLRLNNLANELERSNHELEEFARIASHDLIAPITSTRWLVDLLSHRQGTKLDQAGRDSLVQISDNLQRMSDLIAAVLTHAEVGRVSISSQTVASCEEALAIALSHLQIDLSVSGATITKDDLPDVFVEREALMQLFQNLLSNAIKYREPNRPLMVHVSSVQEAASWILRFEDNGIGIAPEWHGRIFQPLQRLHGREIPGSGIGLATCKKIVDRAGGRIWVESTVGVGSTFSVSLPGPAQGQSSDLEA